MLDWLNDILKRIFAQRHGHYLPTWTITNDSHPFAMADGIPWLLKATGSDFEQLGALIAKAMRKTRPDEWQRIDDEFRKPWLLSHEDVPRLAKLPAEDAVEVLGIATFSASGYAREAALVALASLDHPRATPYVLLRLNDWVVQVRQAALETLRSLMRRGIARELIEARYLIERLRRVQAFDPAELMRIILRYLQSPTCRDVILKTLESGDASSRLFVFKLLEDELDEPLIEKAVADPEATIRWWLARCVANGKARCTENVRIQLFRDKSSRVSVTMILSLTPVEVEQRRSLLWEMTQADAQPTRSATRYVLRVVGVTDSDIAAESRRRIEASAAASLEPSPGLLANLAEVGATPDSLLAERYLRSSRSRVREAALITVVRRGGASGFHTIVPMLDDPSGRVRRAAAGALARSGFDRPIVLEIRKLFDRATEAGQEQALRVLSLQSAWDYVADILCCLCSEHEKVREAAWMNVGFWTSYYSHHAWQRPTRDNLADILPQWRRIELTRPTAPAKAMADWTTMRRVIGEELGNAGS